VKEPNRGHSNPCVRRNGLKVTASRLDLSLRRRAIPGSTSISIVDAEIGRQESSHRLQSSQDGHSASKKARHTPWDGWDN
jgi:hypothetical protein